MDNCNRRINVDNGVIVAQPTASNVASLHINLFRLQQKKVQLFISSNTG